MNTETRSDDRHADRRRHESSQHGSHDQGGDQREHIDPSGGPVARIIAGSVAAGLAAALLLVAVVFAGATEATITGAVLVSFALAWALLEWATTRFTSRPLRWTRVPAAAMGATGIALMAFTPQAASMSALTWIWPAPTVALASYIWLKARRTVPRRGRWMLTALAGVLATAAVGATYENVSVVSDQHTYAAPGKTYDVNGHLLYLDCRGHGGPTVVLFNGMGEVSVSWARIVDQTETHTRVCSYDRAGQGWSGDVDQPQDGITAAQDLHSLLQRAGEHGPYVMAGHSIGGTYALTYAAQYPHQVAGMVLLDSSSPYQFSAITAFPGQYALMRRGLAVLPTLYRLGLGRLIYAVQPSHLPQPAGVVATSLTATARGARNGRDEVSMLRQLFAQSQALTTLGDRPLVVLTASETLNRTAGWARAQDRLAELSSNAMHRDIDSTHMGLLEDQAPAQQSAAAIEQVVDSARTGTATNRR